MHEKGLKSTNDADKDIKTSLGKFDSVKDNLLSVLLNRKKRNSR